MPKRREIQVPKPFDTRRLITADVVRYLVATNPRFMGCSDAIIARELRLSAGYVGLIMSGKRPPTRKFLKAVNLEAVIMYRHRG